MANAVFSILTLVGDIFALVLMVQAVLSFFPPSRGSSLREFDRLLSRITEPVLAPIRRLLPIRGALDFSPLVALVAVWLLLMILRSLLH